MPKEFVLFEISKSNYKKFGELTYEKPAGIAEVTKGEKESFWKPTFSWTRTGRQNEP